MTLQQAPSKSLVLVVAAAAGLTGCFGLPEDVVRLADDAAELVRSAAREIAVSEQGYAEFLADPGSSAIRAYAEREDWAAGFETAKQGLRDARAVLDAEVAPLLDRDLLFQEDEVRAALRGIPSVVERARSAARRWEERRDRLESVRSDPRQALERCESSIAAVKAALPGLQSAAEAAKSAHPPRTQDIDRLLADVLGQAAAVSDLEAGVAAEATRWRTDGEVDLALVGDSCSQIARAGDAFLKAAPALSDRLAELDRSYSRTLVDMKQEPVLVVRRTSWDGGRAFADRHDKDFSVENAPPETLRRLAAIRGWFARWDARAAELETGLASGEWESLRIDPAVAWTEGDTLAEFSVAGVGYRYFHKYLVHEDGQASETDWVAVDSAFYRANLDNLGMDLVSKPHGSFESEKLTQAAPPGMAFVGNPHYGRWVPDGRGGSVWNWLGPYLLVRSLLGSPATYGRSEWTMWDGGYRGARPYYGGSSSAPRYGTRSTTVQTSPKMRGSTFARGGGFQRAAASARAAGPSSRGGSFGASGK